MIETLKAWSLVIGDPLFHGLLYLPSDVRLIAVAVMTSVIMRGIRLFTTDQDLLRRMDADRKQLRFLIREARKRGDRESVKRHQATKARIEVKALRSEGWPLLASLIPVALIATWSWFHLEYHPVREGEPTRVTLSTPVLATGGVAHLIPQDGVTCDAWVQPITAMVPGSKASPAGTASWTIRCRKAPAPYAVVFRYRDRTMERKLVVDERSYLGPARQSHGDGWSTEIGLREVCLFGIVPGMPSIAIPAWLTAYLLIVLLLMPVTKRLTKIY